MEGTGKGCRRQHGGRDRCERKRKEASRAEAVGLPGFKWEPETPTMNRRPPDRRCRSIQHMSAGFVRSDGIRSAA